MPKGIPKNGINKGWFKIDETPWNKDKKTGIVPKSAFKKGKIPWIKGKKMSKNTIRLMSHENGSNWKGNKAGYQALHRYCKKYFSCPKSCNICKLNKKLDLANKNGIYNRDRNNWMFLCRKCHIKYDKKNNTSPENTFKKMSRGCYKLVN